jgi:hypothetical protein
MKKYLIHDALTGKVIIVSAEDEVDAYRAAAEVEGWAGAAADPHIKIRDGAWFHDAPNQGDALRGLRAAIGREASADDVAEVWDLVRYDEQGYFYYLLDLAAACSRVALKA